MKRVLLTHRRTFLVASMAAGTSALVPTIGRAESGALLVFGQSGGGSKVSTLMGMPAAKGLFHRAAAQSGVAVRSGTKARAAASAKRLLEALNVKSITELQSLPWQKIIEVGGPGFDAGPIVDGRNLPADVFDPSASPLSKNVPLITSTVETESAAWGAPADPITDGELLSRVKQVTRLSDSDAQALIGVYRTAYPGKDDTYVCQLLMSQWTFTDAVTTEAERKAAQAEQGGAPEYFFYFAHHTKVRGGKLHAPHTSEIPYCFDSLAASSFHRRRSHSGGAVPRGYPSAPIGPTSPRRATRMGRDCPCGVPMTSSPEPPWWSVPRTGWPVSMTPWAQRVKR